MKKKIGIIGSILGLVVLILLYINYNNSKNKLLYLLIVQMWFCKAMYQLT